MYTLLKRLDRSAFNPTAVVSVEGVLAERMREVCDSVIIKNGDISQPTPDNILFAHSTVALVEPDLVHCNGRVGSPFVAAALCHGARLVNHVRVASIGPEYGDELACSDGILSVSNFVRRVVCRAVEINSEKCITVFDPIDTDLFDPVRLDCTSGGGPLPAGLNDRLIILMVARLAPNKRHDRMLEAMAMVSRVHPKAHLVFVGESLGNIGARQRLGGLAAQLQIDDRVTWLPFQKDLRSLYASADVVVLPSEHEPAGLCVQEAMSMEVPVVVGTLGGTQELVRHGITGFIVNPNEVVTFADLLCRLLSDRDLRQRIGTEARLQCTQSYRSDVVARRVESVYASILGSARPKPATS